MLFVFLSCSKKTEVPPKKEVQFEVWYNKIEECKGCFDMVSGSGDNCCSVYHYDSSGILLFDGGIASTDPELSTIDWAKIGYLKDN